MLPLGSGCIAFDGFMPAVSLDSAEESVVTFVTCSVETYPDEL